MAIYLQLRAKCDAFNCAETLDYEVKIESFAISETLAVGIDEDGLAPNLNTGWTSKVPSYSRQRSVFCPNHPVKEN